MANILYIGIILTFFWEFFKLKVKNLQEILIAVAQGIAKSAEEEVKERDLNQKF